MDSTFGRGIRRRLLIGWGVVVVAVAGVVAAGAPLVKAGVDHADEAPTGQPDQIPPGAMPGRPPRGGMVISGWHGWLGTVPGVLRVTVAALPLAVLVMWLLARRRRLAGT